MPRDIRHLLTAAAASWRPPPLLTVDEWADEHRVLDSVTSSRPGRWRTDRTPYLREPMRRLSSSDPAQVVVLMFGAQLGKTETGNNFLGYAIAQDPGPIIVVQPTLDLAGAYSRQRVARLVESTPALACLIPSAKERAPGNTVFSKDFPGGILRIVGANSPVGLSSMPARYLFADEIDRWPSFVGVEGDPLALVLKRLTSFDNRKILLTSTPTVDGISRVAAEYAATDQRVYLVPCPHCGAFQQLARSRLAWPTGRPHAAIIECESCAAAIENRNKTEMLAAGYWHPTAECDDPLRLGYQLSSLYAPVGSVTWGEIAVESLKAVGNPAKMQAFVNTVDGLPYADTVSDGAPPSSVLSARAEPFGAGATVEVPAGVVVITAGVDVQGDRLEAEVVGWGRDEESWSIDYLVVPGDTRETAVWSDLRAALSRRYRRAGGDAQGVSAHCVDTGYRPDAACAYVRSSQLAHTWAVRGASVGTATSSTLPLWPRRPSRAARRGVPIYRLGVDAGKLVVVGRLSIDAPGPGYCHWPTGRSDEFFAQLTAERLVRKRSAGRVRPTWQKIRERNEALDCRVYAYAALLGLASSGWDLARITTVDVATMPAHTVAVSADAPVRLAAAPGMLPPLPSSQSWMRRRSR